MFAKTTQKLIQRIPATVNRSPSVTLPFSAAAAVQQVQPDPEPAMSRAQPFMDTANFSFNSYSSHHMPEYVLSERDTNPIIQPVFHYPDRFVIDKSKYTIDCSKYDADSINADNEELRDEITQKYDQTGLVYLTNTGLSSMQSMRDMIGIIIPRELNMEYKGGSNWRNYIEPNVYDTGAPKEAWIHYHHEMAYIGASPQNIAFCAKTALPDGRGATFVSDQVQATEDLLSSPFGQKLKERGICYVRNLTDELHYKNMEQSECDVYNHWQKSMGTHDPEEAVEIATQRGLKCEWDLNHKRYGRYLKTRFYADVFEFCPMINKNLLFASVADDSIWFDTWPGVNQLPNNERPIKITYGDNTEFSYDELKQFVDIYDKYGIPLEWKVGDIAVMCNYRWAHGRPQFQINHGEARDLGVVLGQVFKRQGQVEGKW